MRLSKSKLFLIGVVTAGFLVFALLKIIPRKLLEFAAPHVVQEYEGVVHHRSSEGVTPQEHKLRAVVWDPAEWNELDDSKLAIHLVYPKTIVSSNSCVKKGGHLESVPVPVPIPVEIKSQPLQHAATLLLKYQGIAGECHETKEIVEPTEGALPFNTWLRVEVVPHISQGQLVLRLKTVADECKEPKEGVPNRSGLSVLRFPDRTVRCMIFAALYDPKIQKAAFWYVWQRPAVFGDTHDYFSVMLDRFHF